MTDDELLDYMRSPEFERRAKLLKYKMTADAKRGQRWSFDKIARELQVPLDVVLGGFTHSVHKHFGIHIRPAGRVQ